MVNGGGWRAKLKKKKKTEKLESHVKFEKETCALISIQAPGTNGYCDYFK